MSIDSLFHPLPNMTNCVVQLKRGYSTVLELYEEDTNAFLVACVTDLSISAMFLFVKLKDCHLRHFDELCCNLQLKDFVAKMLPADWLTGLHMKVLRFDQSVACEIK